MLQPLMVWIAAVFALLHSARAHDAPPPPRIDGMVALWVEPAAIGERMARANPPAAPRAPSGATVGAPHALNPSGRALLVRDEGVAQDTLVDAIRGVPGILEVQPHDNGNGIVVRHPDLLAVLDHPLTEADQSARIGDVVSIWPLPTVAVRMPTGNPPVSEAVSSGSSAMLEIENPTTARMIVTLEGLEIGELGPRQTARFEGVPAGEYTVQLARSRGGRVRTLTVHAR